MILYDSPNVSNYCVLILDIVSTSSTGDSGTSDSPIPTTSDMSTNNAAMSGNSTSSISDKLTAVGGAVGGVFLGILLLVAVVVFVTCVVLLKRSRKGTEESSTYVNG